MQKSGGHFVPQSGLANAVGARIRVNSLNEDIFCGKLDFTVVSAIFFVTISA